jgi:hypothetical protein
MAFRRCFSDVCGARTASVAVISMLAGLSAWLPSRTAQADRYEAMHEGREDEHSGLNLGFDVEGAIPTSTPRLLSGNNLSGGGGFKARIGDQIRFPRLRVTPEGGYAFDHLFATDDVGAAYAWDLHRLFGGVRVGFGRVVVPGFYVNLGYGWRDTGDPTVPHAGGLAFNGGFFLDLHVIPHLGLGGHAEYVAIDARPFAPQWVALGLHADLAF